MNAIRFPPFLDEQCRTSKNIVALLLGNTEAELDKVLDPSSRSGHDFFRSGHLTRNDEHTQ
jgi:hypothetical protein